MSKAETPNENRRAFLRGSALLGAGATMVAGAPALASPLKQEEDDTQVAAKTTEPKGYRLTQHIANYYRNAAS